MSQRNAAFLQNKQLIFSVKGPFSFIGLPFAINQANKALTYAFVIVLGGYS